MQVKVNDRECFSIDLLKSIPPSSRHINVTAQNTIDKEQVIGLDAVEKDLLVHVAMISGQQGSIDWLSGEIGVVG